MGRKRRVEGGEQQFNPYFTNQIAKGEVENQHRVFSLFNQTHSSETSWSTNQRLYTHWQPVQLFLG